MKKKNKIILIATAGLLLIIALLCISFVYNNLYFYKAPMNAVERAGFTEKTANLPDGTVLNYGEGGSGQPLLLIHGQGVDWTDYMEVLPKLSKDFHIYAVDCHGHGKSIHDPARYTGEKMGEDFAWFIENVIGEPVIVSGHSSGGLITAWLAANRPENIRGVVLEDPPFFSSEAENAEKSFAWNDTFLPAHNFQNQDEEDYFPLYYLKNSMWLTFFGESAEGIKTYATDYMTKHEGPLKIFFLPPSMMRIFHYLDNYDPSFGVTFYNYSWFKNFDHAETLARIECPAVLIHTNWSYTDDGILLAAMSGDDAKRACDLIPNCKLVEIDSGHDSHAEKPAEFIDVVNNFAEEIR